MEIARSKTSSCTFFRFVDWAKLENLLEFGNPWFVSKEKALIIRFQAG